MDENLHLPLFGRPLPTFRNPKKKGVSRKKERFGFPLYVTGTVFCLATFPLNHCAQGDSFV